MQTDPEEDPGVYIICLMCDRLERWDRHIASGDPTLVSQRRTGDMEQYFRLANTERPFSRMIDSAIQKAFGKSGYKSWRPHVVLIWGYQTDHPVVVPPESTPADLKLKPNRTPINLL